MLDILKGLPAAPLVVVEYSRGAMVKRRSNGSVDFVSPLPCPYNYGSIPGMASGDGDALDALVLGTRLAKGTRISSPVVAVVDFVDNGQADPKVICCTRRFRRRDAAGLAAFFTAYALAKRALALSRGQHGETAFRGFIPEERWRPPAA